MGIFYVDRKVILPTTVNINQILPLSLKFPRRRTSVNDKSILFQNLFRKGNRFEVTAHFCHGNAFKYLWRAGAKPGNPVVQDFRKADWYIQKAIELVEKTPGLNESEI